jgi:hypothetical protein
LALIQQEHYPQVSQSLIGETRAGNELQTFDLAKMGGGAEHVYVKELCDIVVTRIRVFLPERSSYGSRFLLDECALIGDGL